MQCKLQARASQRRSYLSVTPLAGRRSFSTSAATWKWLSFLGMAETEDWGGRKVGWLDDERYLEPPLGHYVAVRGICSRAQRTPMRESQLIRTPTSPTMPKAEPPSEHPHCRQCLSYNPQRWHLRSVNRALATQGPAYRSVAQQVRISAENILDLYPSHG